MWYLICSYVYNCDCRCGILYVPMYITVIAGVISYMFLCVGGAGFAGLVSLTSSFCPSPYSSEVFVLGGTLVKT